MPAAAVPDPFDCTMIHWLRQGEPASMASCDTPQEAERELLPAPPSAGGGSLPPAKRQRQAIKPSPKPKPAAAKPKARPKAAKAAPAKPQKPKSDYVGVAWRDREGKWQANLHHAGKNQHLGYFVDEREAARKFDTAARAARGARAHGGRSGPQWWRVNFPTAAERKFASEAGLPTKADKIARARNAEKGKQHVAAREAAGKKTASDFVGVSWNKEKLRWKTQIWHDGRHQHLGYHASEKGAALAFDEAARKLRGAAAHGGHASEGRQGSGGIWRLNFPTAKEVNFSETAELHALDVGHGQAEEELETPKSRYVGVSWHKKQRKWSAYVHHGGKKQSLGYFEKEDGAAAAVKKRTLEIRRLEKAGLPTTTKSPTPAKQKVAVRAAVQKVVSERQEKGLSASEYVGVGWDKETKRWKAQIRHLLKNQHLGLFDDEVDAAKAFDAEARSAEMI